MTDTALIPYTFDRYRNGRLMAEGITVHAHSTEEAEAIATERLRKYLPHRDTIRFGDNDRCVPLTRCPYCYPDRGISMDTPTAEVMPPPAAPSPWEALPDGIYAIVEIMGHQTLVSRVTELERFGTKMMGIEVLFGGTLLPVVLQSGSSIYRFTQVSPAAAWKAQHTSTCVWSLPAPIQAIVPPALLPAPTSSAPRPYDDGGDDDPDDDGPHF
ncbi:hypothetical protein [Reyranella sp.]|uniref:hypothetical protein n=1 Tax=Reyranella sp. TaxID=1929291 RepID=UPI003D0BD644